MARVVLGLASSHSPQVNIPWTHWDLLREKDETDPRLNFPELLQRARPDIEKELTQEKWKARGEACRAAIATLGEELCRAEPDAVVVIGDDQHEQFLDDNLPMLAIFHGKTLPVVKHSGRNTAAWKLAEEETWAETAHEYPAAWGLAEHLVRSLAADEFDIARSNTLREQIGVGHAFAFLYRRILPGGNVPIAPVMVNTYYPPNQPTPKRCYELGRAIRRAIESWDSDARVAVVASGGLSHTIMDEELDRITIEALRRKDTKSLFGLPREKLQGGTSEILCWVALAGAMEPEAMKLVDYLPGYRSRGGTGCGMGFAYWS